MKKIRKTNVITALALTAVMLAAMTGLATADLRILDSSGNDMTGMEFSPNQDVYVTITDSYLPSGKSVDIYVVDNTGWSGGETIDTGSNVYSKVTVSSDSLLYPNTVKVGTVANPKNYPPAPGGNISYPSKWDGTSGGYDVVVDCVDSGGSWSPDGTYQSAAPLPGPDYVQYMGCSGFDTIPEFTTIALPVAGILGLLFFFNHRKHKKE